MPLIVATSEIPPSTTAWVKRRGVNAVVWVVAYLLLAVFPLLVLLVGKVPKGGGFWWDFAMALGFSGLALMGLQSVLTARFRRATAPFGVDIIYYFHRLAAIGAFGLLAVHYLILRLRYGGSLGPLNPLTASWHMTAGRVALILFGVLVVSSIGRKVFRIEYDRWRIGHAVMAVAAVVLAMVHIQGVGHYTHAPWKGAVWISYSGLWLLVLAYIRILKPLRLQRNPYRVVDVHEERGDAWTLTLESDHGAPLSFRPGQFAWLSLGQSPFRAKEHPFSFSGSAADPKALRFTIKELGDFTRTIKQVRPGERAYVDGPHGVFTTDFHPDAPGFVFIAGGVGIAPIMSILRTLADRHDSRPLHLVYGSWRWDGVLFREEIEALKGRLDLRVVHVLQEPVPDATCESGFVTEAVLRRAVPFALEGFDYFLCGPKAMTEFVLPSLRRLEVPLRRIHFEHFEMV